LQDKSFLRRNGSGRYGIHNLIKRYLAEKLRAGPQETDAVQNRHCSYYMTFLQQRELSKGGNLIEIVGQLSEEVTNIRAGWRWAIEQGDVAEIARGLDGLWSFYEIRGWFQEGEDAFGRAAASLMEANEKEKALNGQKQIALGRVLARQGWFCWRLSRYKQSRDLFDQGLAILSQAPPEMRPERGFVLRQLGLVAWNLGDYVKAKQLLQKGYAIAAEFDDGFGVILGLFYRGLVELSLGDYLQARRLFQEALALSTEHNEQRGIAHWQIGLGWAAYAMGEYEEATQLLQNGVAICRETRDMVGIPFGLNNLGAVAYLQGDYQAAGRYFQESLDIVKKTGDLSGMGQALTGLGNVACSLGDYKASREYLQRAVQTATGAELLPEALAALAGWTRLLIASRPKQGDPELAIELLALVLHHPAGSRQTKEEAKHLLDKLAASLPPAAISWAKSGEHIPDLETVVARLRGEQA
jgi:tetratricopeptide (TPR) repeat protein